MSDAHLEDDALVALIEGRADAAARAQIEHHAAHCVPCRELLSALARQATTGGAALAITQPVAHDVASDAKVGRYVLERLIGAGGMGMVFAARDPELDRRVAVKVLRTTSEGLATQDRLRREAQAMAKLSHPNVVAVHDVGTVGDRVFVAMEYVEGKTLARWLETPHALPEILDKFIAAGRGLAAAHGQGLVHRDFKPENVLVGDDGRVRVVDFGIAKGSSGGNRPVDLTRTEAALGTPYYMAPEQYLGEPIDARADQFSFCVALYAAVHGVRPFAGDTFDELAASVIAGRITPPPARSRAPERIQHAILRGLSAQPADRFPTMDALLGELVLPPRRRTLVLAIAGSAVAVAVAVVATLGLAKRTDEGPRDFTLPAMTGITRAPGPTLAPSEVEAPAPDQLGSMVVASTWCQPRGAAVVVTAYGRIVTVDAAGAIATLATVVPTRKSLGSAVACLASGKIVGVVRGAPFVVDGSALAAVGTPPVNVLDAVVVGDTIHWVTPGALWAWSGDGAAQQLRTTCEHPLHLAPDGARVACVRDQRIEVDDGSARLSGPSGGTATWSHDGRVLYIGSGGIVRRWLPGAAGSDIVASGITPTEIGPWLVAKDGATLVFTPSRPAIDLGPSGARSRIVAPLGDSALLLAYGTQGIRVVPLDRPAPPLPVDHHFSTVAALAFSPDGTALVTVGGDRRLITHRHGTRRLVAELGELPGIPLVWRSDGSIVLGGTTTGTRSAASWDASGRLSRWPVEGHTGPVDGTDDLVRIHVRDGITAVDRNGVLGRALLAGPLSRGIDSGELDRDRSHALLRAPDRAELFDLATGTLAFSVTMRGASVEHVVLVPDGIVAIGDTSSQVWAARATGVSPLGTVTEPITALAASPVGHRVAVGAGRTIVIYDLDRDVELARGTIDSTATALAWSRDGRRLAAAATSTQLTIWDVP